MSDNLKKMWDDWVLFLESTTPKKSPESEWYQEMELLRTNLGYTQKIMFMNQIKPGEKYLIFYKNLKTIHSEVKTVEICEPKDDGYRVNVHSEPNIRTNYWSSKLSCINDYYSDYLMPFLTFRWIINDYQLYIFGEKK